MNMSQMTYYYREFSEKVQFILWQKSLCGRIVPSQVQELETLK